jgi:hypothetical protein
MSRFDCALLSILLLAPSLALADEPPKGLGTGVDAASKGKTDVAKAGFAAAEAADDKTDVTDVSAQLGALIAAGNSRSTALTGAVKSKVRRNAHQFGGAIALNYAQAGKPGEASQTSVENLQGLLRYDYFLASHVSVFARASAMHDRFQGLDLRFNADPGVAYYLVSDKALKLWGEGGYDFVYDVRRDDALKQKDGSLLDKTATDHGLRAFVGYDHKLSSSVSLVAGLEYLQALTDTPAWRLNADGVVKASLAKKFSLATAVQLRYDHGALPAKEKTDVITSVSLVYSLF